MNHHRGFTLIETIVALSIFVVSTVIIADIFVRSSQAGRVIVARARALRETRAALEQMVRAVHFGTIDYAAYGTPVLAHPLVKLNLRDEQNRQRTFRLAVGTSCPPATPQCLVMDRSGQSASITPAGVAVTGIQFYIAPSQDPFQEVAPPGSGFLVNDQPRVTIVFSVDVPSTGGTTENVTLQTTVSSRVYKR